MKKLSFKNRLAEFLKSEEACKIRKDTNILVVNRASKEEHLKYLISICPQIMDRTIDHSIFVSATWGKSLLKLTNVIGEVYTRPILEFVFMELCVLNPSIFYKGY